MMLVSYKVLPLQEAAAVQYNLIHFQGCAPKGATLLFLFSV